jgi:hypothetical protein
MKVGSLVETSRRSQGLRYVTVHFRDLQGMRMAPFWLLLLILAGLHTFDQSNEMRLAVMVFGTVAASFGWNYWCGRWYERHYGVVKQPDPAVDSGLISIMSQRPKPLVPNYGYYATQTLILLFYALWLLPDIFRGQGRPTVFALFASTLQIAPRIFYPVTKEWPVRIRRFLASVALLGVFGTYLCYSFQKIGIWSWMAELFATLLLLDLYDHWLLRHLLSVRPGEDGRE